jgi:hypothetical protein
VVPATCSVISRLARDEEFTWVARGRLRRTLTDTLLGDKREHVLWSRLLYLSFLVQGRRVFTSGGQLPISPGELLSSSLLTSYERSGPGCFGPFELAKLWARRPGFGGQSRRPVSSMGRLLRDRLTHLLQLPSRDQSHPKLHLLPRTIEGGP